MLGDGDLWDRSCGSILAWVAEEYNIVTWAGLMPGAFRIKQFNFSDRKKWAQMEEISELAAGAIGNDEEHTVR